MSVDRLFHQRFEVLVEVLDHAFPSHLSFSDFVEFLLNVGCEIVVHDFGEILGEIVVYHDTRICRQEFAAFLSYDGCVRSLSQFVTFQGQGLVRTFFAWLVAFLHIFALLNGCNGCGVGAGSADTKFLELADQTCFVVANRAL